MANQTDPYDLIIIGSGPGGYVAAIRAALATPHPPTAKGRGAFKDSLQCA